MSALPYLLRLTLELAEGMARLPASTRDRHAAFLASHQRPDGGWSGREGDSDLYYTGFALRGLAVLGTLPPEVRARAGAYLRDNLNRQASVVDFFSLLYSCALLEGAGGPDVLAAAPADWPERVGAALESLRTGAGGYAKAAGGLSGSTYHTFLVALCYQLLGKPIPEAHALGRFVQSRAREDGGFVEIAPMKRSGTNPTAAAVGVLQILRESDAGPPEVSGRVSEFLADMLSPEGGLRANGRAPLADLLSTFTGTWTLRELKALDRLDHSAVRSYVESLELPAGGFRGGLWDDNTDVEYTFYGLGCLALLNH